MNFTRSSGILLHPTSLPGEYGIGTIGRSAYQFVDFLLLSGQKLWQIFPLGPTGYGDSPYQSFSAFAGNPLLIDFEALKNEGLISKDHLDTTQTFSYDRVDYGNVIEFKYSILRKAFSNFFNLATSVEKVKYENFCNRHAYWLEDYCLFMALKNHFQGRSWLEWDNSVKCRDFQVLENLKGELKGEIDFHKFLQYVFFKQWSYLKAYANVNGIKIIGDIPIFVALDSADAWANPDIFSFNDEMEPLEVAGVPPDYFSKTGQLWGNPLYKWSELRKSNYKWWIDRIENSLKLVDIIRLDHFRGFAAYWSVPYGQSTAINGKWKEGPGEKFFAAVREELGSIPIIAEDLGLITPDVIKLRKSFNLPGMKVLQFAFDSEEENDYLPHNYDKNSIVYTGTHDNNTTLGWYNELNTQDKEYLKKYINLKDDDISWALIRTAWSSVSIFAIAPLQDLLKLGKEARMNIPGIAAGNWQWRCKEEDLTPHLTKELQELTTVYNRNK